MTNVIKISLYHCVKSVRIWGYSGPRFPAFRLNTERYSGKMQSRITPNTDSFYAVYRFNCCYKAVFISIHIPDKLKLIKLNTGCHDVFHMLRFHNIKKTGKGL